MTSEEILLVEQRDSVRILTLNRPEARNALSSALIDALRTEIAAAEADDETNVVVLTGTDPAFCAGLDLQELGKVEATCRWCPAPTSPSVIRGSPSPSRSSAR